MKARGMVVVVAFLMATVATAAVFLYVNGVRKQAESGGERVAVIVSKTDIPAGTRLDDLITEGSFTTVSVPEDAVVTGAVTSLSQLKGRVTSTPVLAGEQIPTARLRGSTRLPGGTLGIPDGFQAVTVPLEASRVVGGGIRSGDHVTVYATFTDMGGQGSLDDVTVTVVPDARVVRTGKPGLEQATSPETLVTMALSPRDAQKVVFSQESARLWMALLAPGQPAPQRGVIRVGQVTR